MIPPFYRHSFPGIPNWRPKRAKTLFCIYIYIGATYSTQSRGLVLFIGSDDEGDGDG